METKILFFFALIIPGEMWKIKSNNLWVITIMGQRNYFLGMGPSMGAALADNFQPSWKRASAGVGFGGALAENEGTSLN